MGGVLNDEIRDYNESQLNSNTGEILFGWTIREAGQLFIPFKTPYPFQSTKNVFCLKDKKMLDNCLLIVYFFP
jgi:hypothetical protein